MIWFELRTQEIDPPGLVQRKIGLRETGRTVARADLTATALEAGAHLLLDTLFGDRGGAGGPVAPERTDAADGAVEKAAGGRDIAHELPLQDKAL